MLKGIAASQGIAIAKVYPNFNDAPNPDPIANPSGKLCIANPILTTIPVFNKLLPFIFLLLNFFSTKISQKIIIIIPAIIPKIVVGILLIFVASGTNSKQTTAIIKPDANESIKLKILLENQMDLADEIDKIDMEDN